MSVSNLGTSFLSPSITYAGRQPFYGAGGGSQQSTISTFQQLFTSSITGNTASFSSMNLSNILTSSIIGNTASFSSINSSNILTSSIIGNTALFSTISSTNINCSSITVLGDLDLNGNDLTTSGTFPFELLLNGIPIATTSNISSLSDWAFYPAVSSINAGGNFLSNVPAIEMSGANGFITGVSSINGAVYPPVTGGVTSFNTLTGAVTISGGTNISLSPVGNNITINATGSGNTSTISGVNTFMLSDATLAAEFADATITAGGGLGGNITMTANSGDGTINGGAINMTANGGGGPAGLFGAITMTANSGSAAGIATGGSIELVANSGTSASNLTSKISLSAGGLNLYSGVSSPFASLFGYTYINALSGISLVAGAFTSGLQAPGTVYLYGTTGITLGSDTYANRFFPTWDTVSPPANLVISGRTTVLGDAYVALSNVSTISFDTATAAAITGLSTINGLPYPPTVSAGVASLNSQTGVVDIVSSNASITVTPGTGVVNIETTPVYQATYYNTTAQNLASGNTDISFDSVGAWNNTGGYITHVSGTTDFTVVQAGLYQLEFNAIVLVNNGVWTTATNKTINIDITRSLTAELAIITSSAVTAAALNYGQSVSGTYYLEAGDVINLRLGNTYTGGTPTPPQASGISNTFDLNTFFTWSFISSGGATAYQNPPPVIQAAGTTALIPTSANTTYILTSGTTQNFTTAGLGAGNAGLVWYVKNATGTDITIEENGTGIAGYTSTSHRNTGSGNSSICILYWDGTILTMY